MSPATAPGVATEDLLVKRNGFEEKKDSRTKVVLTVTTRDLPVNEFGFDRPALCIIGRSKDCTIQIPRDYAHADVSRRHCILLIDQPTVFLRDLGSLNGTFLNGKQIGQPTEDPKSQKGSLQMFDYHEVKDGDWIRVGSTVFLVRIQDNLSSAPSQPPSILRKTGHSSGVITLPSVPLARSGSE